MEKTEKGVVKRSPNWDQEEKELLLKLILEKLDTIENAKLDTNTNKMKKEAWQTVHTLFNLSSPTTERTLEQIQNQWRKMKYVAKIKRVGDDSSLPETQDEMELISRLTAKHFEPDCNSYDNILSINESSGQLETGEITIKQEVDEILTNQDNEEHVYYGIQDAKSEELTTPQKRTKHDEDSVESSKRIRLLELDILQKESEIKYAKIEFDKKVKVLDLQMKHMNDEHNLRMQKLKFELHMLKN